VSDSELVNNRVAIQVSSLAGLTMTGDRFAAMRLPVTVRFVTDWEAG